MKKILITAALAAMTVGAFAQGSVQFQNAFGNRIYINSSSSTSNIVSSGSFDSMPGSTSTSAGVVDVAILWGTAATSLNNFSGPLTIDPANPGEVLGSTTYLLSGSSASEVVFIDVVAWDSSFGNLQSSIAADVSAGGYWGSFGSTSYGVLAPGLQFTLGPTGGPGQQIFGTLAGQIGKIVMTTSPEPATFAIGGLGAAALLFLRRRK